MRDLLGAFIAQWLARVSGQAWSLLASGLTLIVTAGVVRIAGRSDRAT